MTKVLIIGAHGAMAQLVTARLLHETETELVLFLRNAQRLNQYVNNPRVTLVDGSTLDTQALVAAMAGVDLVYSNAGGTDLGAQTEHILAAMQQAGLKRLLFISALGAHHEVGGKFGQWNEQAIHAFLPGFREAAALLENSQLDYTEIRPSWLTDDNEVDYERTTLAQPFVGTEVSRASVADFVMQVIQDPSQYVRASIGLSKPNTAGDKPRWL
jgi:uncharacterized protein YbjT (DUF2867 family)